ncbi:ImmA/IrrE family metallo-endopeptidase [Hyphomicrobium album]|nr:ImmA/IrrE family metallo-endopeptidase [Hyphomicrobium album]
MDNKEAWATTSPPEITIRESRLNQPDDPETRFILSHELFHVVLHPEVRSFLVVDGNAKLDFRCKDDLLAIYHNDDSHELQATVGARAFLMPEKLVRGSLTASALAKCCRVPQREAALRFAQFPTAKKCPGEVTAFLAAGRAAEKLRLWKNLAAVRGEPPEQVRLAGLFRIDWNEFHMMTQCGWTVENGKIVPYLEMCAARFGR